MSYDSVIVTLILAVEVCDFWVHYKKEREKKLNTIRRVVNRFIKEAQNGTRTKAS